MTQTPDPDRSAIVFGGGGIAGIAWELGVLSGLLDEGIPLQDADLVVGTSAGSMVGTILRFGMTDVAYQQQLQPLPSTYQEPAVSDDPDAWNRLYQRTIAGATDEQDARAKLGAAAALTAGGQSDDDRVATFRETFPTDDWPDADLAITAIDAVDGRFRVFTKEDGVELTRAIAASCSVPFVWSPVKVDGRSYIDGGFRSATNADIAAGAGRVLVIACGEEEPGVTGPVLSQAVEQMRQNGSHVEVVVADAQAQQAFGTNTLALSTREPSARAGRIQAGVVAERVRAFWVD